MANRPLLTDNNKSIGAVVNELKQELKEFIDTRYQMLRAEMKAKLAAWKAAIPMFVIAAALAAVAFLMLSVALVSALAMVIGWGWSFLAVGVFYLLLAAVLGWVAYREVTAEGVAPERTLRVLKQDQQWFQQEARSQTS